MRTYFSPALTSAAFPVAAQFAAAMVYGRSSADNELTACRASGISFLSLTTPAVVLGLVGALVSLLFLCFILPVFTFKVEQVVYSNLAQLGQNKIERTHPIKLEKFNVYAQSARIIEVPPDDPGARLGGRKPSKEPTKIQCVELTAPMIASYTVIENADPNKRLVIATEFYLAKRAYAYISQKHDDVELTVKLENASRFVRNTRPRETPGKADTKPVVADVVSIGDMWFGPVAMRSPIAEEAKFMTIDRLKALYEYPKSSRRLEEDLQKMMK